MKDQKLKSVIFLGIFILGAIVYFWPKDINGVATKIIDGDTILIENIKVRLAYIDTPESKQYSFSRLPIGLLAKNYLEQLIKNKTIRVRKIGKGIYGRSLGVIFLNDENINLKMVADGYALAHETAKWNYHQQMYLAQILRKGLFKESFINPKFFRKLKRKL